MTAKISGVPKWTYVSKVAPSRFAEGTAYVTFDGHRGGDYATYAFVTTDFGATWQSIASNLPKGEVVRTIAEDMKNADVLYIGTETGVVGDDRLAANSGRGSRRTCRPCRSTRSPCTRATTT